MALHHFGTDGVRGVALSELTENMAYRIGRYLGQYPSGKKNKILVAMDTRLSGPILKTALIKGLLASGAIIYDLDVSTTPSVSYLVEKEDFDYGIMISASHNPYSDNGIKVFDASGEKLCDEIEELIEGYMDQKEDDLPLTNGDLFDGEKLKNEYIDWLSSFAPKGIEKAHVIVDCANGSASKIAPVLFKKIGLKADFINNEPDGKNINFHCGSTHLEGLLEKLKAGHYDFGFAYDGDADRFLAFSKEGRLIDGDAQIFLASLHERAINTSQNETAVITVMSNFGLRKAFDEEGISYLIVPVGDKNVQAKLKEEHLHIGGEQSGHVIYLNLLNTGDGLLSCLKLLEVYLDDQKTYSKLTNLKVYPQSLINVRVADKMIADKILSSAGYKKLYHEAEQAIDGTGRLLVRLSGTEPLIRVMVEALDQSLCESTCKRLVDYIQSEA